MILGQLCDNFRLESEAAEWANWKSRRIEDLQSRPVARQPLGEYAARRRCPNRPPSLRDQHPEPSTIDGRLNKGATCRNNGPGLDRGQITVGIGAERNISLVYGSLHLAYTS